MNRLRKVLHGQSTVKQRRYVAVSVLSVVIAQATLAAGFGLLGWSARFANVVAFIAGALPAYTLNRRWTWERSGRSRLLAEVAPYWALSVLGLGLSTWAVGFAEIAARGLSESRAIQTLIVLTAAIATTGVLWGMKFLAFEFWLFRAERIEKPAARPAASPREGSSEGSSEDKDRGGLPV